MNYYQIKYNRLVWLLMLIQLRKPVNITFLRSLIAPVTTLHQQFLSYKDDANYKINHNSQVCYLQAVLNDAFDNSERRIYISDAETIDWSNFLWKESEDKPIMLYHDSYFMLNSEKFIGSDAIDFVVNIPIDLNISGEDKDRMNALVKYYKLASKRYIIFEV